MSLVATANAVVFGLGLEPEYGVPGSTLIGYEPVLPVDATLTGSTSPPIDVNRSGYPRKGVPGPKAGTLDFGHRLTVAHLLELLEHVVGHADRTVLEAGVYRYVFEPPGPAAHVNTSLWGLIGREPVDRSWFYGARAGKVEMQIGDNTAIPARLTGIVAHGTRLGPVEPQPGNTGTYTSGPHLRGVLADPDAGDVWLEVTRDVAGGGVQFKAEQTSGVPAFGGSAVDVVLDADGRGTWQNLQGADGRDLGLWAENKDPLEVIFPGDATDLADLAVGDQFRFRVAWDPPALSTITALQSFTSALWTLGVRKAGSTDAYRAISVNSGTIGYEHAVEADRGNSSRYAYEVIRTGNPTPTMTFARSFADRFFMDLLERHEAIDLESAFLGAQIGTGVYRESLVFRMPSASIGKDEAPVSGDGRIQESLELRGETDDDGNPPVTITAITTRDWTPSG